MREKIITWLKEKCDTLKGLALYLRYGDNERFKVLLLREPARNVYKLKLLLCRLAGLNETNYSSAIHQVERDKFREMYPFIAHINCPNELKILASDKITTYWKIVDLHEKLFNCDKNEDCRNTVAELVNVFIEDQEIKQELDYYKQHGGILGHHRIFETVKKIDEIRKMSIKELIKREQNLRENIWRIRSEIAKGDKPHLLFEREKRLREREKELEIVLNILGE